MSRSRRRKKMNPKKKKQLIIISVIAVCVLAIAAFAPFALLQEHPIRRLNPLLKIKNLIRKRVIQKIPIIPCRILT